MKLEESISSRLGLQKLSTILFPANIETSRSGFGDDAGGGKGDDASGGGEVWNEVREQERGS